MELKELKDFVGGVLAIDGMIGRDNALKLLNALESAERERDSALSQFRAERGRADLAVAQCDDLKASIIGPVKDLDKLKLRIESLAGRVDAFETTAPTQWAYNAACQALHKHRARADAAEAEIARRDAATPVSWQFFDGGRWYNGSEHNNHRANTEAAGYVIRDLFPEATGYVIRDPSPEAQAAVVSDDAAVKPFAYSYRYAGCETSDGFQDWREELSRDRPADWMIETGKVTDLQELHIAASPQEPVGSVMGNSWVDDDDRGENYWVEWVGGRFPPKGTSLYTMPPAVLPDLEQDVKNIIGLLSENEWAEHCTKSEIGRDLEGEITRLHDMRAQPAVLPPEKPVHTDLSRTDIMKNIAYNQALNDVKELGAQPPKPVTIPGRYDIAEMSGDPWQSYRCIEPDDDGEYIRLDEILSALNDAGVPHTGGK